MNNAITANTQFEKELVGALNLVVDVLQSHQEHIAHLEGHIAELSKQSSKIVVKVRNRKVVPFALGAVAGIYVYRKFRSAGGDVEFSFKGKDEASWSIRDRDLDEKAAKETETASDNAETH